MGSASALVKSKVAGFSGLVRSAAQSSAAISIAIATMTASLRITTVLA